MRNRENTFNTFPKPISFSSSSVFIFHPWLLYLPLVWAAQGWWEIVLWSVHNISTLPLLPPNAFSLPKQMYSPWSSIPLGSIPPLCCGNLWTATLMWSSPCSTSFPNFTSHLDVWKAISFQIVCWFLFVCLSLNFPHTSPSWGSIFSNTFLQRHHHLSRGVQLCLEWVCWNTLELSVQNGTGRLEARSFCPLLVFSRQYFYSMFFCLSLGKTWIIATPTQPNSLK